MIISGIFFSPASPELLLIALVVASLVLLSSDAQNHSNYSIDFLHGSDVAIRRVKRRTQQPQQGFFFPIAMYTVRHHRPATERGRNVRPETWEYRGQYFYGYRPRANAGRRQTARLLAAGLPLLLAPLLSIIFSFPVVIPIAQMTGLNGGFFGGTNYAHGTTQWGRRRRKRGAGGPRMRNPNHRMPPPPEKAAKLKELEVVANYLQQVDYDEKQQSRVMVNYLQCNGLLGTDDHCLERLSCEFGDPANENAPELERTVTSILLGHILNNEFIPRPFIRRIKSAAVHGRNNSGTCNKYFCHYVDNNWDFTSTYPKGPIPKPPHIPPPQRPG
ncbi:uncharacterized protein LOC129216525 [Uloborus diversus]|uniref:uncharacterized protein LOC129216525 n=1 Tax=Uloborus diversus TaxID=327109 RepID=UPI00240A8668|nr:uncharacterized protein LOC129216525 [Uloborus diversus]